MAPTQLHRKAVGFLRGLHGASGIAYLSTVWAGVTVAVCVGATGGICTGSMVFTAVLSSAAAIGYGINITGSDAVSAKRAVLAGLTLAILLLLLCLIWNGTIVSIRPCLNQA